MASSHEERLDNMWILILLIYLSGVSTVFTLLGMAAFLVHPYRVVQLPKIVSIIIIISILWPLTLPLALFGFISI